MHYMLYFVQCVHKEEMCYFNFVRGKKINECNEKILNTTYMYNIYVT